mmetsp:Transcript_35923/g.64240  ORF Transcript_35923/g.64240 Transcript_35923/m.64240 type:complete len:242 (+) Transcript_35923:4878-5603(+)
MVRLSLMSHVHALRTQGTDRLVLFLIRHVVVNACLGARILGLDDGGEHIADCLILDGKVDLLEIACILQQQFVEDVGHGDRRIAKGPTAQGTEDESVVLVLYGPTQERLDLPPGVYTHLIGEDLGAVGHLGHCGGPGALPWGNVVVDIKCRNGHQPNGERLCKERVPFLLRAAEDGHLLGQDAPKHLNWVLSHLAGHSTTTKTKGVVRAPDQVLFLRGRPSHPAPPRLRGVRHVEHQHPHP